MDHRKILLAYIEHVLAHESITYIGRTDVGKTAIETDLTNEERTELARLGEWSEATFRARDRVRKLTAAPKT